MQAPPGEAGTNTEETPKYNSGVFGLPCASETALERLGTFGLVEMFIFIDILILGLVYAIRKGVMRWE